MAPETLLRALRKSVDGYHVSRLYIGGFGIAKRNGTFRVKRPSDYSRQVDKFQSRLLERMNVRCETCRYCETYRDCCDEWESYCTKEKFRLPENDNFGYVKWRKRR